jgi:hypothetical protein
MSSYQVKVTEKIVRGEDSKLKVGGQRAPFLAA